jgi:DNA-binding XRE family transcriptional regulator
MTAQIVEIAGQKIAMLPVADYYHLLELAEDQADIAAAERAEQRRLAGEEEFVPFELINSIIEGENALRAWRKYRGYTQEQLAEKAKVRKATVSEIESGKAQGKPAVWRSFADVLKVAVDDILPLK